MEPQLRKAASEFPSAHGSFDDIKSFGPCLSARSIFCFLLLCFSLRTVLLGKEF